MGDTFQGITIFQSSKVGPDGAVLLDSPEHKAFRQQRERAFTTITGLLSIANLQLTPDEQARVEKYQQARLILGASGAAVLVCRGTHCCFAASCPLVAINKAPLDELCPFEANYVTERFLAWMMEMERTLETLSESERAVISNLVYIDLQEQRCTSALSRAENALMVSRSVRDVDLETGQPICWEDVIHINRQILSSLTTERRMLLKDFELTPEAKSKRRKLLGEVEEDNLAKRQSALFAQLRKNKAVRLVTIDPPADTSAA